jgi:hypothetical protein
MIRKVGPLLDVHDEEEVGDTIAAISSEPMRVT